MNIRYDILFRLSVLHDFYEGDIDPNVKIVPTLATKQLLKNYGMLHKADRGRLNIVAEVTSTDNGLVLKEQLQSPLELVFTLQFQDSFWGNYTSLYPDSDKTFFFTNSNYSQEDNHTSLHPQSRVTESDQIKVLSFKTLTFPQESEVTLVRKGLKEEDRSAVIKTVQNQKVISTAALDDGLYEITENGSTTRVFIIDPNNFNSNIENIQGVFHVLIDPNSSEFAPVVDTNWALQSPEFSVHFKNRSSLWRYYFTKSNLEHLEGLQITNGSEETSFGAAEDTVGPNGQPMILISSNEPLEITDKPTQHLQLKKNMNIENRSEGVVIDRLPVPNRNNLYRVGEDGSIFTDLFINL